MCLGSGDIVSATHSRGRREGRRGEPEGVVSSRTGKEGSGVQLRLVSAMVDLKYIDCLW